MKPSEKELVELTFKDFFQEFISVVAWTSAVSVDEEECLVFQCHYRWFAMQYDSDFFLEIVESPEVMVACE